ncbi:MULTISPECIES: hypothetical protein [unclassified Mycobacterium]|uniref:hypothetical protein n=1 Tax=unclassified Mycobacterium TaxID=2642494 RepID=UPI00096DE735|nr:MULTISPECIES: hypothetical protein [unclassified Mycobacterium]OMC18182.1 hypothetical protein A5736_14890 [Mycobacterium sp. SP-6446]OMC50940.1 hypothetical protein A5747_23745 [Mycobacterium sp. IS-836]
MVLLVLKVALIVFIVGATVALITRGVKRSRANRSDPRWKAHRTQPGYEASALGAMPNTPLPEWANWDDEGDDPVTRSQN